MHYRTSHEILYFQSTHCFSCEIHPVFNFLLGLFEKISKRALLGWPDFLQFLNFFWFDYDWASWVNNVNVCFLNINFSFFLNYISSWTFIVLLRLYLLLQDFSSILFFNWFFGFDNICLIKLSSWYINIKFNNIGQTAMAARLYESVQLTNPVKGSSASRVDKMFEQF